MRRIFYFPVIMSTVMLSGCASLQMLSFGASTISYAVSGKSISDHAISTVMDQDCALHRVVVGEETCVEHDGTGILRSARPGNQQQILIANESHWQQPPTNNPVTPPAQPQPVKKKFVSTVSPDETVRQLMAANKKSIAKSKNQNSPVVEVGFAKQFGSEFAPVDNEAPQLFAVVGSYNELRYARDKMREHSTLNAQIVTNPASSVAKGATKYRVVVGPMTEREFNHKLGSSDNTEIYHAWRLRLCGDTLLPPPCTAPMLARHSK